MWARVALAQSTGASLTASAIRSNHATSSTAAHTAKLPANRSPPVFAWAVCLPPFALAPDATGTGTAPGTAPAAEAAVSAKAAPAAPAASASPAAASVGFAGAETLHVRSRRRVVLLGEPLTPAEPIPRVASFAFCSGLSTSCTHSRTRLILSPKVLHAECYAVHGSYRAASCSVPGG